MIGLSRFLMLAGILLWIGAFFVGPDNSLIWGAGKWGIGVLILGCIVRLVLFLIPSKRSAAMLRKKRHGEERKCLECGRPAVPGSQYCRYHTDVMNRPEEAEKPPEPYGDY
jgi:hypothetical protein